MQSSGVPPRTLCTAGAPEASPPVGLAPRISRCWNIRALLLLLLAGGQGRARHVAPGRVLAPPKPSPRREHQHPRSPRCHRAGLAPVGAATQICHRHCPGTALPQPRGSREWGQAGTWMPGTCHSGHPPWAAWGQQGLGRGAWGGGSGQGSGCAGGCARHPWCGGAAVLEPDRWAQETVPCGVTGVAGYPQCRGQCHAWFQGYLRVPRTMGSPVRGDRDTCVSPVLCGVTSAPRCPQGKVPCRVTVLCLDIPAAGDSQCHGQVFPVQVTALCKVTGLPVPWRGVPSAGVVSCQVTDVSSAAPKCPQCRGQCCARGFPVHGRCCAG